MGIFTNPAGTAKAARHWIAGFCRRFDGALACGVLGFGVLAAALVISSSVHAWTIDFEDSFLDLPNPVVSGQVQGRIIDDEFSTPGLIDPTAIDHDPTLTASFDGFKLNGNNNPLVLFNSNSPTGGDYDLGAPFTHADTNQVLNPGQILILHEQPRYCRKANGARVNGNNANAVSCDDPDDRANGGEFQIEFNKAVTLQSIDFFDIEYNETLPPDPNNEITLFDVNGNQILGAGAFYTPSTGGDNKWKDVIFNVAGVAKIKIKCSGSCAIDNIRGTDDGTPPTGVPEPSTVLLFAAGLIGGGWYRRRKKTNS